MERIQKRVWSCWSITVHKNLFVSYIITAFCFVIYLSVVSFGDGVLMENPVSVRNFVLTMYSCRFEYMNFTYCQTCKSKNNSKTQLLSLRQTDAIFWRQTSTLFITSDSPRQRSGKVNKRSIHVISSHTYYPWTYNYKTFKRRAILVLLSVTLITSNDAQTHRRILRNSTSK